MYRTLPNWEISPVAIWHLVTRTRQPHHQVVKPTDKTQQRCGRATSPPLFYAV